MSFTIWFTGFSGAGKSTLSKAVYLELKSRSLNAEWLDGDIIRSNFSQELTFSKRDRDINVKRIGFVSHLLNKNDVVSVVAAIAPYADTRDLNRKLLDTYVEVFCNCPLDTVIQRDVKGLYKKALAGDIPHFTGVSDPYEKPESPELNIHTDRMSVEESVQAILRYLEEKDLIPLRENCSFSPFTEQDENTWRKKLCQLGFSRG